MKTKSSALIEKKKTNVRPERDATENPVEAAMTDRDNPTPPRTKRSSAKRIKDSIASALGAVTAPLKGGRTKTRAPGPEVSAETRVRRVSAGRKKIEVPKILLEGDEMGVLAAGGPGKKYALGLEPPVERAGADEGELPEGYGTKKLFLTARDPHWLYANWDLTQEQQARLNARSGDGHLVLRIYPGGWRGMQFMKSTCIRNRGTGLRMLTTLGTRMPRSWGFIRRWAGGPALRLRAPR